MKKINKFLVAMMAVALPLSFTGCGSDDDDGPENPGNTNNPTATAGPHTVFTTLDGNKVTLASLGGIRFKYNAEDYAVDVNGNKINYESGKIVYADGSTAVFKLNSMGYIASFDWKYSSDNPSQKEERMITAKISYDESGQITKCDVNETLISIDKSAGSQSVYEESYVTTYFWRDGAIASAVAESTARRTVDTQTEVRSYKTEFAVNFDGKLNQLGQYTLSYASWFQGNELQNLALVGLLGKAPSKMTMSIMGTLTGIDFDGTTIDESGAIDYSYTIDSTGKIQTETVDSTPHIYTYNNVSLLP